MPSNGVGVRSTMPDQASGKHRRRQDRQTDQGDTTTRPDTNRQADDGDDEPGDAQGHVEEQVQRFRPGAGLGEGERSSLHLSRAQR